MKNVLNHWQKDWTLMPYFFNEHEIQKISNQLKNLKINTLAYCSYENRFGRSGGLGAVTAKILPYLNEVNHDTDTILITPFHSKIIDEKKLKSTDISFDVSCDQQVVKIEIWEYTFDYGDPQKGSLKEYYLKADDFFDAQNQLNDPYIFIEDDRQRNEDTIRENALFFCKSSCVRRLIFRWVSTRTSTSSLS